MARSGWSAMLVLGFLLLSGTGPAGTVAAQTSSEQDIARRYREAHQSKDVRKAMDLVYWAGVDEPIRASFESNFREDFQRVLRDVQVIPPAKGTLTEYSRGGVTYRPNLPVVKTLVVRFEKGADGVTSTTYLLGTKDGRLFITTAVAVK